MKTRTKNSTKRTTTSKCSRCSQEVSRANLTLVGDEKVCALCMYAAYEKSMKSPAPAKAVASTKTPMPAPIFPVADVDRAWLPWFEQGRTISAPHHRG